MSCYPPTHWMPLDLAATLSSKIDLTMAMAERHAVLLAENWASHRDCNETCSSVQVAAQKTFCAAQQPAT